MGGHFFSPSVPKHFHRKDRRPSRWLIVERSAACGSGGRDSRAGALGQQSGTPTAKPPRRPENQNSGLPQEFPVFGAAVDKIGWSLPAGSINTALASETSRATTAENISGRAN